MLESGKERDAYRCWNKGILKTLNMIIRQYKYIKSDYLVCTEEVDKRLRKILEYNPLHKNRWLVL